MDIILSNSSDKPIYEQISSQVKAQILSGALAAGAKLPSIRALASDLGVSVITTKRAYADLEQLGFICTVQGKGCFVAEVADREMLRARLAADSVRNTVFCCKSLGYTAEEVTDLVTNAYNEPTD